MIKFPTAGEVIDAARPLDQPPITDDQLIAQCERCDRWAPLSSCKIKDSADARRYHCSKCSDVLALVREPNMGGVPIPGSGLRIGAWVFANPVEVLLEGFSRLRFPAMVNATSFEVRLKSGNSVKDASAD